MTKDAIPFWENNYREKDIVAFSSEPNATVTEFEHLVSTPAAMDAERAKRPVSGPKGPLRGCLLTCRNMPSKS